MEYTDPRHSWCPECPLSPQPLLQPHSQAGPQEAVPSAAPDAATDPHSPCRQLLAHFHCVSCDRPLHMLVPGP